MNIVALRSQAPDGRIARLEIFEDMTAAEPHWRALECAHPRDPSTKTLRAAAVKRTIKQHAASWSIVRATRRLRARLSAAP